MKKITFTDRDIHRGCLQLVSAAHPIREEKAEWKPLALLCAPSGEVVMLADVAARMMRLLLAASGGTDCIRPVSGFRSKRDQQAIYAQTLREKGENFTRQFVALPGCSEHQTGLALDVGAEGEELDFICPAFPAGGAFDRFRQLAPLYGFIERYPEGKSHLTGIAHEPWHFRYVGWPHAKIITDNGWTLEEYIDQLRGRERYEDGLLHRESSYSAHVFTVRPPAGGQVSMRLAGHGMWQASGNNVDGVVVTVWGAQERPQAVAVPHRAPALQRAAAAC